MGNLLIREEVLVHIHGKVHHVSFTEEIQLSKKQFLFIVDLKTNTVTGEEVRRMGDFCNCTTYSSQVGYENVPVKLSYRWEYISYFKSFNDNEEWGKRLLFTMYLSPFAHSITPGQLQHLLRCLNVSVMQRIASSASAEHESENMLACQGC